LTYQCVCGNGVAPNITEYSLTLPYFICVQWGQQCVANCGSANTACQSSCTQDHPCGALNPTRYNTTSSSTASATATGTDAAGSSATATNGVYNGLGGSSTASAGSSTPTKSGAQAVLNLGRSVSASVVVATLFAGFALMI
jgi:cobalamin biosynthesis Mg chelatase CobN